MEMLKAFGVGFEDKGTYLNCEVGMEKVEGYIGFYTVFNFNEDGSFNKLEVGE